MSTFRIQLNPDPSVFEYLAVDVSRWPKHTPAKYRNRILARAPYVEDIRAKLTARGWCESAASLRRYPVA